MALPSNVQRGKNGCPLKVLPRFPVPGTSGVNIFSQGGPRDGELLCVPAVRSHALRHQAVPGVGRRGCHAGSFQHLHPRSWLPYLNSFSRQAVRMSEVGQFGMLEYPSRKGYVGDVAGLPFELWGLGCYFPAGSQVVRGVEPQRGHPVLIVSDSLLRGMNVFGWPASFIAEQVVCGGARMETLRRSLASSYKAQNPEVAVLHGGRQ